MGSGNGHAENDPERAMQLLRAEIAKYPTRLSSTWLWGISRCEEKKYDLAIPS